jgi:PAS domain S-box-containing protein
MADGAADIGMMITQADPRIVAALKRVSQAAGVVAFLGGSLVVVGWLFDIPILKSGVPGLVAMKANTAIAFMLVGASLWLLRREPPAPAALRLSQACAIAAAGIGAATLFEYLLGVDLGIDQLLFREPAGAIGTTHPGRMALATAASFLMLGTGLLLLESRRWPQAAQYLAFAANVSSVLYLMNYAYGVRMFGPGPPAFTPMAIHTSLLFLLLSVGLLFARPDRGPMAIVSSDTAGGAVSRRFLPVALVLLAVLGFLGLQGERAGLYDETLGVSLMVVSSGGLLIVLVWLIARGLHGTDLERRRAEEALQANEARLQSILDNASAVIYLKDLEGRYLLINRQFEHLFHVTREEVAGKTDYDYFPREMADAFRANDRRVLEAGAPESLEEVAPQDDGVHTYISTKFPLRDPSGAIHGVCGISTDITERKRAENEVRRARETAESVNRELEAFSYSVSHDLRAPLRHIGGFADLLLKHAGGVLDTAGRGYLDRIASSVDRMGQLIDDLLAFSRMGRAEMRRSKVDLGRLVREVRKEVGEGVNGRSIDWQVGDLPEVEADPALLRLVFTNLISNAVKYTRTRLEARIEIGARSSNGDTAVFVRDNGVGFDMRYAHKLFGVFQRLHSPQEFEGNGIGLANVRRIIQRHGGRTWAEGQAGRGATFYFSLPKQEGGAR